MINTISSIITKTIPAGGKWSARIRRGKEITFTALEDGANVSLLLYNADDTAERYNVSDTLKAQHTAFLTKGNVLMSDNGHVLASIVEDEVGWHDAISGYSTRHIIEWESPVGRYELTFANSVEPSSGGRTSAITAWSVIELLASLSRGVGPGVVGLGPSPRA